MWIVSIARLIPEHVAVLAALANLGAAHPGVPGGIGPLDRAGLGHRSARAASQPQPDAQHQDDPAERQGLDHPSTSSVDRSPRPIAVSTASVMVRAPSLIRIEVRCCLSVQYEM